MYQNRLIPKGRAKLVSVLATAGNVISVDHVAKTLEIDRNAAAQRLSRWVEQGWMRRVGRGMYVAASIETMGAERVLDDPWVLVPALYSPAYIGGRTAAEHWDLTEQIFTDIVVLTTRALREKLQTRHGTRFSLKHIAEQNFFGTKTVWRHETRVLVSDVHRTIIDMLDDLTIGGGLDHVNDCLISYLRRRDRDDEKLIAYALQLGNGAVFKRLGFLAERLPAGQALAQRCEVHLSGGHAKLDPAQPDADVVAKWRLRVPPRWARGVRT